MPVPFQVALTIGPLAAYFFVLGAWQSGRDPKIVGGALDFALLLAGMGGLVCFGPVGDVLVALLFPGPSVWAWLTLPTVLVLLGLLWAPRARRRLVIYNVSPEALDCAVRAAAASVEGSFTPTLRGLEDTREGRGLWVDASPRSRTGVVEAYGRTPDALIAAMSPALRRELRGQGARSSAIARLWFALSGILLWAPALFLLFDRHGLRKVLRALLQGLG